MTKRLYVVLVRLLRAPLHRLGVLGKPHDGPRSPWSTWFQSIFAIYDIDELSRLDVPWWTFTSAGLVEQHLQRTPHARVYEWGSGASTLWLARRAASVVSVEHDEAWATRLDASLPANVDLRVVPPIASATPVVGSQKPGHAGLDFEHYVAAIDETDGEFDVIVIDGRAREACLDRAVERLAPNGLIVFDNVDRQRYLDAITALGDAMTVTTTRGLTPALPYPTRTALLSRAV